MNDQAAEVAMVQPGKSAEGSAPVKVCELCGKPLRSGRRFCSSQCAGRAAKRDVHVYLPRQATIAAECEKIRAARAAAGNARYVDDDEPQSYQFPVLRTHRIGRAGIYRYG